MRTFRLLTAAATALVLVPAPWRRAPHDPLAPVTDVTSPRFWDAKRHQQAGGEADRFELDDTADAQGLSAWYHLSYVVPSDRLQVREHNPSTTVGLDTAIGHSENVAWHVAATLLGESEGLARPGELPAWARPRTGASDGPSAGLLFALADLDLLTPGDLAGDLIVAATGAIGSDGSVTAVRMVDAKLAAARLVHPAVVFAPDFPGGSGAVTVIASHQGQPTPSRTIGDWLNTSGYEAAGRVAARHSTALVPVDDVRQALAWLCGRTGGAFVCGIVRAADSVSLQVARPYQSVGVVPSTVTTVHTGAI
jgi:hypothetical protein